MRHDNIAQELIIFGFRYFAQHLPQYSAFVIDNNNIDNMSII